MNKALKPFFGLLMVAAAVIAFTVVQPMLQAKERIPWRIDITAARAEARAAHKPVFLYFTATWCGPCQSLKHTTWADADVASAMEAYVPVKIDIDENKALAQQYGADQIPKFVIVGEDGRTVKDNIGAVPPREFLDWLNGKTM